MFFSVSTTLSAAFLGKSASIHSKRKLSLCRVARPVLISLLITFDEVRLSNVTSSGILTTQLVRAIKGYLLCRLDSIYFELVAEGAECGR
jgi:hypothetical protein